MWLKNCRPTGAAGWQKALSAATLRWETPADSEATAVAGILASVKTMLRLKPQQRALLVDKVPDVANIIAGALVIGFFFGEPRASWPLLTAGLTIWLVVLGFALAIAEDKS